MISEDRVLQAIKAAADVNAERTKLGLIDHEADRNIANGDLFEAIIREAHEGVTFVAAGHHFMVLCTGRHVPLEIPSADSLIFDHRVAKVIWGADYKLVLSRLALEPAESRDVLLRDLYEKRAKL